MLWSDEAKINLFGSNGKCFVHCPVNKEFDPKYIKKTVKHDIEIFSGTGENDSIRLLRYTPKQNTPICWEGNTTEVGIYARYKSP